MLPALRRQPDLVSSTIINLYKSFLGNNASRLPAVRFHQGTLFLTAINKGWQQEGRKQESSIIKVINQALKEELVKDIRWVPWPEKFKQKKEEESSSSQAEKPLPAEFEKSLREVKDKAARQALRQYLNKLDL